MGSAWTRNSTHSRLIEANYIVGVDLGGTKILSAVVDPTGCIISRCKILTKPERGVNEVIARIVKCICKAIERANLDISQVRAMGIGAPGVIDSQSGVVVFAPNLCWSNIPLKARIEDVLKRPIWIDNDVTLATLAEQALGAARGYQNLVGIFAGTGVGGAIMLNGVPFRGVNGTAGEIGHVIIKANGPKCTCGNRGCLEVLASRTAITREIRKAVLKHGKKSLVTELNGGNIDLVRSKVLAQAVEAGDEVTIRVLEKAQRYLGMGVALVVNFLNPEIVVLGGGVVDAMGDKFVGEVRAVAAVHSLPKSMNDIEVVAAELGGNAGAIGASVLARRKIEGT